MITKFKIFEFNELDPYGEDNWGNEDRLYKVSLFTSAEVPNGVDFNRIYKKLQEIIDSFNDENTSYSKFVNNQEEALIRDYDMREKIDRRREIRRQTVGNSDLSFLEYDPDIDNSYNCYTLHINYKIKYDENDYEPDDIKKEIFDCSIGELRFFYIENTMENTTKDIYDKDYEIIKNILQQFRINARQTFLD